MSNEAKTHLAASCEIMAALIDAYPAPQIGPVPADKFFDSLVGSIIGQQLSVKAAGTIEARVREAVGDLTPEAVAATDPTRLRSAGLSGSKVSYLGHLADAFLDNTVVPYDLPDLSDAEVITSLTRIRGVGVWTAEMFLIFGLGRLDVWSAGDWGLTKGVRAFFGEEDTPTAIATRWAPYRSIAAWYVWEHVDRGAPPLDTLPAS